MAASNNRGRLDVAEVQPEMSADHSRHVEQVLDEPGLCRGVSRDDADRVRKHLGRHRAAAEHRRPADDRVQRRPQLVRDRRQELVLGAVGNAQPLFRSAQVLGGPFGGVPGPDLAAHHAEQQERQTEGRQAQSASTMMPVEESRIESSANRRTVQCRRSIVRVRSAGSGGRQWPARTDAAGRLDTAPSNTSKPTTLALRDCPRCCPQQIVGPERAVDEADERAAALLLRAGHRAVAIDGHVDQEAGPRVRVVAALLYEPAPCRTPRALPSRAREPSPRRGSTRCPCRSRARGDSSRRRARDRGWR